MPGGDIWRVAARISNAATDPPEIEILTFWVQAVGDYSGPQDLSTAFAEAFQHILTPLPTVLNLDGVYLKRFAPTPGPTFEIVLSGHHGAAPLNAQPTPLAIEVLKKSGLRGRSHWGRNYVSWTPISWTNFAFVNRVEGVQIAAWEANWASYHATMLGPNSSGTSWLDGVYSFRAGSSPPGFTPVSSYVVHPFYREQGRRARRAGAAPPFPETIIPAYAIGTIGTTGLRKIFPDLLPPDGRQLQELTHWNAAWTTYPVPPANWLVPGSSLAGWDGNSCVLDHSILYDQIAHPDGFFGWDWPPAATGHGVSDFPYAFARYTSRVSPILCGVSPNAGGVFDTTLWVRDFNLLNSPVFAAELQMTAEQGAQAYINGTPALTLITQASQPPALRPTARVDVTSLLVPNAVNRISVQQFNNNVDVLHNPALWDLDHVHHTDFYQDYPFVAFELNVIQEPI